MPPPRSPESSGTPAAPPHRVRLPVNIHEWRSITFLHWPVEPETLRGLVPDATELLTYDGAAWVGVTPFHIRVRPPGVPFVPPRWAFPETNVRTYVRTADGRSGLWFLRMEVTALWFVVTLRAVGLPYFRQRMSVDAGRDRIAYRSEPRSGSDGGGHDGGHDIVVRVGEALDPPTGGPRERFFTARWGAYHRRGPLLLYTPVEHEPWSLRAAEVETCAVAALFGSAGLPAPRGQPLAHYSNGVAVKVGRPEVVRGATSTPTR